METLLFTVVRMSDCPTCLGSQVIYDPTGFWKEFWDRVEHERPDAASFERIFKDCCDAHGAAHDNPPIEETPCDCGIGAVRSEVSLASALAELGYPTAGALKSRLEKMDRDAYHANNVASCLANGMIPD